MIQNKKKKNSSFPLHFSNCNPTLVKFKLRELGMEVKLEKCICKMTTQTQKFQCSKYSKHGKVQVGFWFSS
jgi:actin-related protein